MAAGAINVLKEVAVEVGRAGAKKGLEGLKEGKPFKEVLKNGFETAKESAFKELDKILSPESQQKLTESSEKLENIQDKVESETETVEANPAEEIKGTNEVTEKVNDVAKEIMEEKEPGFLSEIIEGLQEFKEVLKEIQEVQDKLKELGVSPDMLSMLNAEALEIDEMNDLEEEEEEGEGTE
jgi:hypothetical protein